MSIDHDLHQMLFQQREAQTQHLEYNQEFQYYNAIASGDIENVSRYFMKEDDQHTAATNTASFPETGCATQGITLW